MESVHDQRGNGKLPARVFEIDGDETTTARNGGRRAYYVATAAVNCFICFRASNHSDAEQEAEGWFANLLGADSSELLVRAASVDVDVMRVSRSDAAELFGENIALLEPSPVRRCECGAPRDRGRRLCGGCRLERLRERDARQAAARNGKLDVAIAPLPGQLERFGCEPRDVAGAEVVG